MTPTVATLGFWSALLSAAFAVTRFVKYGLRDAQGPVPPWHDTEAYARAFSSLRTLYVYPSLGFAL